MRTTLDIDDDLLLAAKELARREQTSAGRVVSRLLRGAMTHTEEKRTTAHRRSVAGFRPLPAGDHVVSNEQINLLRDVDGL